MSRYPSESAWRFDQQFAETEYERNARQAAARRKRARSTCDVCGGNDRPTATIVAYGIETNACDKCRGVAEGTNGSGA